MTWRVVIADKVAKSGLDLLAATPEVELVSVAGKPREDLERALAGAHALIVRSETRVTADLLARAPNLRVVARAGTGVDTIDVHAATRRGIAVMNAPGANTVSAGEHAMGLLLALVRRIPEAAAAMRQGEWDRKRFEGTELRGKTIGVVGLGRIGGHVAQLARAFGMHVVAHDPYLLPERAADLQVRLLALDDLLRAADVVTLHVALTDETRHLINAERLRLMKPTAVLINTARGELVDDAALAAAVREKRIGGAAIDVFAVEPLPADSPLRGLDRVLLTPHLAASTAEAQERVAVEICAAVREALLAGDLSFAINVPGIGGDALKRLAPLLDLARRLGRLALALADGPVKSAGAGRGEGDPAGPEDRSAGARVRDVGRREGGHVARPRAGRGRPGGEQPRPRGSHRRLPRGRRARRLDARHAEPRRARRDRARGDGVGWGRDQHRELPPGPPLDPRRRGVGCHQRGPGADERSAGGAATPARCAAGAAGVFRGLVVSHSWRPSPGNAILMRPLLGLRCPSRTRKPIPASS